MLRVSGLSCDMFNQQRERGRERERDDRKTSDARLLKSALPMLQLLHAAADSRSYRSTSPHVDCMS